MPDFADQFRTPPAAFRDAPFWSWNCRLREEELRRQIRVFRDMGMGGFFMHPRVGLKTPYLSEEFLDCVGACVDEAKRDGLLACLYDEDRWPSGTAGGMVTCQPQFQARHLELRCAPTAAPNDRERFLQAYLVRQGPSGELLDYRLCAPDGAVPDGFRRVWCWRVIEPPQPRFNDTPYIDALNPRAVEEFLRQTHERYRQRFGGEFGAAIPAIFTDEPQLIFPRLPVTARERADFRLAYTDDFPETYRQRWHAEFLDTLPELFWDLPEGRRSAARYRYYEHLSERFAAAYADTIGRWCAEHGLASTGHLMLEPRLESQTRAVGEAMRSYRSFQIPGIDILCDDEELSTAKQAQSAARQFGRARMLSELDGVTDWDFPFYGHKGHGDWQAALGVNLRVPHLAWLSMGGESKRDYPAPIDQHSAWHRQYPVLADHFARLNAALTQGAPRCRIAVVHPVESFWLLCGPQMENALECQQAEADFDHLFQWLLKGLLDFDLLAESLLPDLRPHPEGQGLQVGRMRYEAVVVPPCLTLRGTTLDALEAFRDAGGAVFFAGEPPALVDALPSERARALAGRCPRIPFTRHALLAALEPWREVRVLQRAEELRDQAAHQTDGTPVTGKPSPVGAPLDDLLLQLRDLPNGQRILFLANTLRIGNATPATVSVRGRWQLELLDTASGAISPLQADQQDGWTHLPFDFYPHGHLLLRLTPAPQSQGEVLPHHPIGDDFIEAAIAARVPGRALPYTLDEPNALMLDMPEASIDGGPWLPREEILRLDNRVRAHFGLRLRQARSVQPWLNQDPPRRLGTVALRYQLECRAPVDGAELAMEQPEKAALALDGAPLPFRDCGHWIDPCLRRTAIPALPPGLHTLTVTYAFDTETVLERLYLLGGFAVRAEGDWCALDAPARALHWGDLAPQGLPFFGGNLTYHARFTVPEGGRYLLRLPSRQSDVQPELTRGQVRREVEFASFRGALVTASLDGGPAVPIAFAPFQADLGFLSAGEHRLDLTLGCTRVNGCGAVHLANRVRYCGPPSFRTSGNHFSYDYTLIPQGILRSPLILRHPNH